MAGPLVQFCLNLVRLFMCMLNGGVWDIDYNTPVHSIKISTKGSKKGRIDNGYEVRL